MDNKINGSIQMIADYDGDISTLFNTTVEGEIPILATRNLMLFPGVLTPILIGRKQSLSLINKISKKEDQTFAIFCQKDAERKKIFSTMVYTQNLFVSLKYLTVATT